MKDIRNEYEKLSDELLIDIDDLENDYQRFLEERKNILVISREEKEKIEAVIKLELLKMWSKAKKLAEGDDEDLGYFRYEDIYKIPYVSDYFNIVTANGDRNIGKTYSSRRMARDVNKESKRWFWLRNIDDEIEAQVDSDKEKFLDPHGWIKDGKKHMPNILDRQGNLVGYYRALNTSAKLKSIEFPEVDLLVYEEFNEVKIQHKYMKFIKLLSTIQRQNPKLKAILQANYVDQNDEMLQALGVGMKKLTKEDFVIFNWEVGALIINIPKGVYRQPKDKKNNTAYRASLATYDGWKSQYGGGFSNEEPVNIINENEFSNVKAIFNIYTKNPTALKQSYGAYKLTLYHVWDKQGKQHNVITTTKGTNNSPIFVIEYLNKIHYPTAELITHEALMYLINAWNNNNLKTTSIEVHAVVSMIFAKALQIYDKQENDIEDVENMVS